MNWFSVTFLSVFFCLGITQNKYAFAEQKILFCAESIEFSKSGEELCQKWCQKHAQGNCLENELKNGWKVDAVSPKTVPEGVSNLKCNCIGQQYVLSRNDEKAQSDDTDSLSRNEARLLKKENELLKKEVSMLKDELKSLRENPQRQ